MKSPAHYHALFFLLMILPAFLMGQSQTVDLTPQADFNRPLENPHKGWYHHYYDNGVHKYLVDDDSDLDSFPGMDHLYIRLAWSYFEKEEDQYDWSRIDELVDYWVPKGYKLSFRVTAKETSGLGEGVNQKVDDICYATPKWVRDAGAQGTVVTNWGIKHWEPVWDDPVFLEKWDDFHAAFAARYDGQPYVSYIDLGGIGDWGEGHTGFSSNVVPTVEQVKAHIDIFKGHYRHADLMVADGFISWGKSESDEAVLLDAVLQNNISIRDDSPLVDYWLHDGARDNLGIERPDYFKAVYVDHPVVLETQHYHLIKEGGDWIGTNGSEVIPALGVSGADVLRDNIKTMHATYVGYHGYADEWLRENPDLARELTNLAGYWYTINQASFPAQATAGASLSLDLEWENKGVAPAYHPYALKVKLAGASTETITLDESHNLRWKEGEARTESYTITLPSDVAPGRYALRVKLKDQQDTGRDIDLALSETIKDAEGYFTVGDITVAPPQEANPAILRVRARLTDGSSDQLALKLDGTTVATWTINDEWNEYIYEGFVGTHHVEVYFPDAADEGSDAQVDYLSLGEAVYQAEDQAVNTSVWQGQCGGSYSEYMHCAGSVDFGRLTGSAPLTTITVYAAGRTNTETMELRIDGQTVKSWTEVKGNANNSDFVAYSYTADGAVTASQIQVAFTNGGSDVSRDLRVDKIEVEGVAYQSEEASTYSTGTWTSSNGCDGGFKRSEWLHCDGYFAYDQTNARTADADKGKALAESDASEVQLFPNPAQDVLHVHLPSSEGRVVITLTDLMGREVLRHRQAGSQSVDLPVQNLPKGVYQVNVQQAGQQTIQKLLVE